MSKIRIYGDTSGYVDVAAPATADNSTLDLSTVAKTTGDQTFNGDVNVTWSDTNFIGMPFSDGSQFKMGMQPISSQRDLQIVSQSNDSFGVSGVTVHTGSTLTERMRIDASGRVTMPYQPSFFAKGAQTRTSGAFTAWGTVYHNNGNHFNSSTGVFTAPVNGYYQCNGVLMGTGVSIGNWIGVAFQLNGSTVGQTGYQTASTTNDTSATVCATIYATANDALNLFAANQAGNYNYYSFSIHLVG